MRIQFPVVSTYKEPIPAWINNLYGPTGVVAGAGTGVLRALHASPTTNANIVPVDMCVNALIATAWQVNCQFDRQKPDIPIYNYESSNDKPINWSRFMNLSETYGIQKPSVKAIWYYCFNIYGNFYVYTLVTLLLHIIPALLIDGALLCMGKSPKWVVCIRHCKVVWYQVGSWYVQVLQWRNWCVFMWLFWF